MRPAVLSRAGLQTGALYALIFATLGAHLPFWPLWLGAWGLTAAEIGSFTALGVVVRIAAGLAIPALADALGQRRLVLAMVAAFGALVFAVHPLIDSKAILLVATLASGLVYPGMIPISDALGTAAARDHSFPYAHARAFGSLAFLVSNLACGWLISIHGTDVALVWIVICLVLTVRLAMTHPGGGRVARADRPHLAEMGVLLRIGPFLMFVAAIAFAQGSHAVNYVYGSVHWAALGLGEAEIGGLWAFSVAVEVVLMFTIGGWLVVRCGPVGAISLSAAAGVLRWGAMVFDPTGAMLWALQALHAVTFALGHLGAIAFIAAAVPERLGATAQGLFGSVFGGVTMAGGMWLASLAYPVFAGGTYAIAGAMSVIGLVASLMLSRLWSGERLATA